MKRHISYEKLSKKEKRKRDLERRITWSMNPVTRKNKNKKIYDRNKSRIRKEEIPDSGIFYLYLLLHNCKFLVFEKIKLYNKISRILMWRSMLFSHIKYESTIYVDEVK